MIFAVGKSLRWGHAECNYMPISELIDFYELVVEQWEREEAEIEKARRTK
jgi:hypothetical protein